MYAKSMQLTLPIRSGKEATVENAAFAPVCCIWMLGKLWATSLQTKVQTLKCLGWTTAVQIRLQWA